MRERWLLQGTPTGPDEKDEESRRQVEQDELHIKKLEDSIQRMILCENPLAPCVNDECNEVKRVMMRHGVNAQDREETTGTSATDRQEVGTTEQEARSGHGAQFCQAKDGLLTFTPCTMENERAVRIKELRNTHSRILESEIILLENEESQISAKEQVLRERLRETESSIEDLQKSLQNQDGENPSNTAATLFLPNTLNSAFAVEAPSCCREITRDQRKRYSKRKRCRDFKLTQIHLYHCFFYLCSTDARIHTCSQIPRLPGLNPQTLSSASGDHQHSRTPALYAMEINVEKDHKTGNTKILSTSRISPEAACQRGVKVYDDGRKVIYEVHSGSSTTVENGVHPLSSDEVEELIHRMGQAHHRPDGTRVTIVPGESGIRDQSSTHLEPQSHESEMKIEQEDSPQAHQSFEGEVKEVPEATANQPITMIFMGYHSVDDEEETKKLLGFDGTIKAEIVLIDEDDEKSLREKTVTDISTVDGNAADLVSGRPVSEATELSSEGQDESTAKELPSTGSEKARCVLLTAENGLFPGAAAGPSNTPPKSCQLIEDDTELKSRRTSEKSLKSVSFLDPVTVISGDKIDMEVEVQSQSQLNHATNGQNGVKHKGEVLDEGEVAQEIRYLDEVLEANCCDTGAEMTSNGTYSPVLQAVYVDGNGPSVQVSDAPSSISSDVSIEGKQQTIFVEGNVNSFKPNGHPETMSDDYNTSPDNETIKKEARFELRPFFEEKKPAKLFDTPTEKEIRVKKVRPSEEVAELERERLELIRDQAVKKNPGIAAKWWNPPQEKTLEEELEPEKLESLKRYEERKQKRPETSRVPQAPPKQTVSFVQSEIVNKDDIVVQGIDFSVARQQFLQTEHSKHKQQQPATKRNVSPQIYSARPFFRSSDIDRSGSSITVTSPGRVTLDSGGEMNNVKIEKVFYSSGDSPIQSPSSDNEVKSDEFTCAKAVMTILKDEDSELHQRSINSSYHPEELDSGLDDLSLRSQDTTVLETLSNDFSMDNISDSGASNEIISAFMENSLGDYSFPSTPQATTPINGKLESSTKSPCFPYQTDSYTEEDLEYHAGILVQNAIQQAIAHQTNQWEPLQAMQQSSPIPVQQEEASVPSPATPEKKSPYIPPDPEPFPVEEKKTITPTITVHVPTTPVITTNAYRSPSPSSPPNEKSEFSYFSKYSEAAELRSTASVTPAQGPEITSGPFKLRSRKQRTLSMIEEEIRAAQEREEELRKERQAQTVRPSINPIHKRKTNSLPAKLVLGGKTAPGKIEKIRVAPPVSPASSDGALPSPLSDLGSDDSGGNQRPKNFMQTLMEDYETHKVRRREKAEDNTYVRLLLAKDVTSEVLEATRVTRRKSNMALRWEAGIYANQEDAEEGEEEE
ncbi:A-kinase anchor protein 2 isoform X3 [Silurus meridionalis]|nr:A-kinase anchor protein 2 isoform X3 [Silurus meridionalis]